MIIGFLIQAKESLKELFGFFVPLFTQDNRLGLAHRVCNVALFVESVHGINPAVKCMNVEKQYQLDNL